MRKNNLKIQLDELVDDVLSSFNGDDLVGFESDDLVGFSDIAETFQEQLEAGRIFQLTVTNGTANNDKFYLNPSYRIPDTQQGHPLSGKGIEGNTLTFTGSPTTLAQFYGFLKNTPANSLGTRLQSSNVNQLQVVAGIYTYAGPFDPTGEYSFINYAALTDQNALRNDVVVSKKALVFDRNMDMIVPILANTTLNITIVFGAMLDTGNALRKSTQRALQKQKQVRQMVASNKNLKFLPRK